jgi:sulfur-oxidizing protein SoxZ
VANNPNRKVSVPDTAKRGEVIEIKTLIMHPMENGFRVFTDGSVIPVHIIQRFTCAYNGEIVFDAEWFTALAANPFFSFFTVATESGTLEFTWYDDDGSVYTESAEIEVT